MQKYIYTFETYVYLFFLIFMRNHKKRELEKVEHKIVDGNNQGMADVEIDSDFNNIFL